MDRILKSYSREEIAEMEPGKDRFYLAEDVEREIGRLRRELREVKEAPGENREKVVIYKDDRWICNGNVPDPDPAEIERQKWGLFG